MSKYADDAPTELLAVMKYRPDGTDCRLDRASTALFELGTTSDRPIAGEDTVKPERTGWYDEFKKGSVTNDQHLIKRSHYGGLQVFHSMAVELGEPAATTKSKAVEWARFNVELALGKVDFKTRIEDLPARFNSIQFFFRGHCAWEIRSLLAGSESYGNMEVLLCCG